ncbi:MAG: pilus assembly protein [Rhodospirillales bacterium]|nr:pilus assembly protein [Rhodospirillales bacterium]
MKVFRHTYSVLNDLASSIAFCRLGAAAVEFALLVPIIMFGLTGVADYGMGTFRRMELASAARSGSQYAIYNGTNTTAANITAIQDVVVASTNAGLTTADVAAVESYACDDGTSISDPSTDTCADSGSIQYYMTITITQTYTYLLWAGTKNFSITVKVRTS